LRAATLLAFLCLGSVAQADPAAAVVAALADAQRLAPDAAKYARYLSLYAIEEKHRREFLGVQAYQVNSISREAELVTPRQAAADLTAIDIRDYNLDSATWEKLAVIDPYFHVPAVEEDEYEDYGNYWLRGQVVPKGTAGAEWKTSEKRRTGKKIKKQGAASPWLPTKEIKELIERTGSAAPIVRADWFFVQTARQLSLRNKQTGVGYYDWLKLKDRGDLFKLIKFSEKDSIEIQQEIRAALDRSGVSQQNRQIVAFRALTGRIWITLDVKDEADKGNAIRNLKRGDFQHDAEEIYAVGRNGLPVYFLSDDKGVRQDSAPDFIGGDDSAGRVGRDARIHVSLACIRCHGGDVLQPINDWARRTYTNGLVIQSPDYDVLKELRRQYLSNLDGALAQDRAAFRDAIRQASGLEAGKLSVAYGEAWNRYAEQSVTLEVAAFELGCPPEKLMQSLKGILTTTGQLDPVLAVFTKTPPGTIQRVHWEEVYSLAQTNMRGLAVQP